MTVPNDKNITANLQTNNLWGAEYNYFVWGILMPGVNMFGLMGGFAALFIKQFIVNFTEKGIGIMALAQSGDVMPDAGRFIPREQIQSVVFKTKLASLGLSYNVTVTFTDDSSLKLQVNKWVPTIKAQGQNLKQIKIIFRA